MTTLEVNLEELEIIREGIRRLQLERNRGHDHISKTADLNSLLKKVLTEMP